MKITSQIALRYLLSSGQNRFFSFISILSILGIAIAIAAMIVVLSVINGFESQLRDRFLAANAHVMLYKFPSGIKDYEKLVRNFEKEFADKVTGASPFVHMQTMAKHDTILHSVLIRGIHPSQRENVQPLGKLVRPAGALDKLENEITKKTKQPKYPGVILGIGLSKLMSVEVGEVIGILSPMTDDPLTSVRDFQVVGIYDSGLSHYDNQLAIISIPASQSLFQMDNIVTGIEMGLKNPSKSPEFADLLSNRYSNVTVRQWQDYNKTMFEAIKLERSLIALLVALVAVVGGFNILTTLFVSVVQKSRDIAVLKSIGALNQQIVSIFIRQGLIMGTVGSTLGACLAFVISKALQKYQFIQLPEIYMLESLPVEFEPAVYLATCAIGVLISTLAGVFPAWNASKHSPSEGLKVGRA